MLIHCADAAYEYYEAWRLRYEETTAVLENREERVDVILSPSFSRPWQIAQFSRTITNPERLKFTTLIRRHS